MPESALINLYGSSEVAADATYYDTRQGESLLSVPIGRPIANTQIYILDRYLNPAPIGIPGEIHIGGDGLARGYLNRPDLTRESFIDSPFGTEAGAVLYKTGDLGRYFENGNIEFLGRRDHQIKLRGYRIELGEIEGVLSDCPEVRECVVVVREDKLSDERLIAYVVAEAGATIDDLRRFLDERLPKYMIPSAFVLLDRLPLSPNNKLDRAALPEPDPGRQQTSKAFVAPRDDLEIQLARLWEEALGVRPVGVRDNFFEIGGHSLLAVSLFAEIEKTFNKRIPLAALFLGPTIENLANLLRADISSSSWSSLVPIKPDGSKPPLYLVHPWGGNVLCYRTLAHLLGPDQPVYGLQPQGLDGKQPPLRQIEDMAAHYLKEISSLQPAGPYYIGGLSSGGTIAFEMAQQLQRRGQNAALLVLFDTFVNPSPESIRNPVRRLPNSNRYLFRADVHLGNLLSRGPKYLLERTKRLKTIVMKGTRKVATRFQLLRRSPLQEVLRKVQEANLRAFKDYVPKVYPGRITLFITGESSLRTYQDGRLNWSELAGQGLELHVVPGDHLSMIEETSHVTVVSEKLRTCLSRAQA